MKTLKILTLGLALSTSMIYASNNAIIGMLQEKERQTIINSTPTRQFATAEQYLQEFEIQYKARATGIQTSKGFSELKEKMISTAALTILFPPAGIMYGAGMYARGVLNGGDEYYRQRPDLFQAFFPEENEARNAALEILQKANEEYIAKQDKSMLRSILKKK